MGLLEDLKDGVRVGGSDLNGYVVLLIITMLLIVVPGLIIRYAPSRALFTPEERRAADSIRALFAEPSGEDPVLFAFDPNTIGADSLELLGCPPHIARRFVKYRDAGGQFYRKQDVLKIYGFDSALYSRLSDFIRIRSDQSRRAATRDLNRATSRDLREVAGLAPSLCSRTIGYRRKLGGYISMWQLHEVYGMDSSAAMSVSNTFYISDGFEPTRIDINGATEAELSSHPYIGRELAHSVMLYRTLNGPISDEETLRSFQLVDDDLTEKLFPYLEF